MAAGANQATAAPTLETVAARAGVSRATVSRVVNGSPKVSPQVREAVQAAIGELGYVPNPAARSLVTRRTDTIAMVVPEPDDFLFADAYLTTLLTEVNRALEGSETQLVLVIQGRGPGRGAGGRMHRYVTSGHVDGAILVSVHRDNPLPRLMADAGVPAVLDGRPPVDGLPLPYVDVDNVAGAQSAAEHLVGLGRRRIATIAGPADMTGAQDRLTGFVAGLRQAGLTGLVEHGDYTEGSGFRAAQALLAAEPRLDGLFAASDQMAVGALRALRQAGRDVPGDVAVVGYDDLGPAATSDPPLTSVRQPVDLVAQELVRLLAERIEGRPAEPVVLPTTLVRRASA